MLINKTVSIFFVFLHISILPKIMGTSMMPIFQDKQRYKTFGKREDEDFCEDPDLWFEEKKIDGETKLPDDRNSKKHTWFGVLKKEKHVDSDCFVQQEWGKKEQNAVLTKLYRASALSSNDVNKRGFIWRFRHRKQLKSMNISFAKNKLFFCLEKYLNRRADCCCVFLDERLKSLSFQPYEMQKAEIDQNFVWDAYMGTVGSLYFKLLEEFESLDLITNGEPTELGQKNCIGKDTLEEAFKTLRHSNIVFVGSKGAKQALSNLFSVEPGHRGGKVYEIQKLLLYFSRPDKKFSKSTLVELSKNRGFVDFFNREREKGHFKIKAIAMLHQSSGLEGEVLKKYNVCSMHVQTRAALAVWCLANALINRNMEVCE